MNQKNKEIMQDQIINPLSVILLSAEDLSMKLPTNKNVQKHYALVDKQVKRCVDWINAQ